MTQPQSGRPERWRPNIPMYLLVLVVLVGVAESGAYYADQRRSLDRAERNALEYVEVHASMSAERLNEALTGTAEAGESLAANPGLSRLFAPGPPPDGCELSFTGAGPFSDGHLAVVDANGSVRCSSLELPDAAIYADAPWLEAALDGPGIHGPYVEPQTGEESLVVTAPIPGSGLVATFLQLDPLESALSRAASADRPVRFAVLEPDESPAVRNAFTASSTIEPIGWELVVGIDRNEALAGARASNRLLMLGFAGSFIVMILGTYAVYLGLARPIQRLSAAIRGGIGGPAPDPEQVGGPAEVARIAQDFTDLQSEVSTELKRRRQAEREAASSKEYYRRIFATNPVPMWIYDTDGRRILDVNDAAVEHYGYARNEFTAMAIDQLWPADQDDDTGAVGAPTDGASATSAVRQQLAEVRSGRGLHVLRDGTLIDVEVTSHAVDVADLPACLVMAEDVTARERSRRVLERAERMESLGQLAGGIAHDFNNVLAVMLSYAEFAGAELAEAAREDPDRWAAVHSDVEQIGIAGRRAASLTQQLLAFARGESAEAGPVDLNEVARETQGMLHRTLGEQVDLELALEPDLWPVIANAGQMTQVIVNLAVNARDAMPDGGRLLVETSNVVIGEDELSRRPGLSAGRHIRLRVSDTGSGMDATTREHAFEPLFSTKGRGQGTGLGLATVYGIVSRAGGEVHLYSEPGLGTTVNVLLPAADVDATVRAVLPETVRNDAATTGTILVVEDDHDLRAVTERILAEAGHTVLSAAGGAEALALFDGGGVDLLLTDVVMPEMAGPELAARLADRTPDLRVLFMSGYAPPLLFADGRLPHGSTLLDKPFSASTLLIRVHETMERHVATVAPGAAGVGPIGSRPEGDVPSPPAPEPRL